jgi:hypothetical protein
MWPTRGSRQFISGSEPLSLDPRDVCGRLFSQQNPPTRVVVLDLCLKVVGSGLVAERVSASFEQRMWRLALIVLAPEVARHRGTWRVAEREKANAANNVNSYANRRGD